MLTQIEADIDADGSVVLLEPVHLEKKSRAIVTIIDLERSDVSKEKTGDVSKLFCKSAGQIEDKPIARGGVEEMFGSVDLGYATNQ